jgi:hypothetical protein
MNANPQTICHSFPLRNSYVYLAQVVIPIDMTKEEADRLCDFIQSLAMPELKKEIWVGKWDEMKESWSTYKSNVRKAEENELSRKDNMP